MTTLNFDRSLLLVLKHEGGYVDHSKDPGGATNMGITIGTLRQWRSPKPVSKADVKALTRTEAAAIYRANYWRAIRGDDLPAGLDYAVFDFAVNSGIGRAVTFLQNALGVEADVAIGPKTIAVARASNAAAVVADLCDRRLAWLQRLKTWPTFGKGWTRRVEGVRKEGVAMARAAFIPDHPAAVEHVQPPPPPDVEPPMPVPPSPSVPASSKQAVGLAAVVAAILAGIVWLWDYLVAWWNYVVNG